MWNKISNGTHKALIPMVVSNLCGSMYHLEDKGFWLFSAIVLLVYGVGEFIEGYRE